jgi:hypothetical protein
MHARISFDLVSDVISRKIMSITKHLMLSSIFNHTWPKYLNEKTLKTSTNQSNNQILSDTMLTTNSWIINRFTIVQRSFFILSLVSCFFKKRRKKNIVKGKIFRNIRESRQIVTLDGKNVE